MRGWFRGQRMLLSHSEVMLKDDGSRRLRLRCIPGRTQENAKSGTESGLGFLNGGPRTMKKIKTLTRKWPTKGISGRLMR